MATHGYDNLTVSIRTTADGSVGRVRSRDRRRLLPVPLDGRRRSVKTPESTSAGRGGET